MIVLAGVPGFAGGTWSPPTGPELARLEQAIAGWDRQFDPAEDMLRQPLSSPGYHTALKTGFVHPTRQSLSYALGLLDTGREENIARAMAILRKVLALQDRDPASPTFGLWSWFLEEPLGRMNPPDWNWADFNGITLLQIFRDHRARLSPELTAALRTAITAAGQAIRKRNAGPDYTNIAVMGTYVTLVGGECLGDEELRAYGLTRLKRFADYTHQNGGFAEYNSPPYTSITLLELSRLQAQVQDASAQELIQPLLRQAWEEIAQHFHPPTRQWAGPNSRAYDSLMHPATLAMIERATAGQTPFGVDRPDPDDRRIPLSCPADLVPLFQALPAPRAVVASYSREREQTGTTYLHADYALGSITRSDLWGQRRALLLHFGSFAKPGYLQLRFLKDGHDFASAWLTSAQREGLVTGIVNFATNGGDTHIVLDKIRNARFRAGDLRLRFELGGATSDARIATDPAARTAVVDLGKLAVHLQFPFASLDGREGRLETGMEGARRWLDVVLYTGPDREFDLQRLTEAAVGFVLSVGSHGKADLRRDGGDLTIRCDSLSVQAPLKPGPQS